MKELKRVSLVYVLLLPVLLLSQLDCSKKRIQQSGPITSETVIATVEDEKIILADVYKEMTKLSSPGMSTEPTPENCITEAITSRAVRVMLKDFRDYDQEEIHRLASNRLMEVLMGYMFQDLISKHIVIPDSSIDSFYRTNLAQYTVPERRRVTHLLISDNPKAWEAAGTDVSALSHDELLAKAKALAEEYYQQIKAGADIADLAEKYSHDTGSKPKRGDSGLFQREQMVAEFSNVAFKLPIGAISPPIKSIYGYHLLRVDEKTDKFVDPLSSELRDAILHQLISNVETREGAAFVDSVYKLAKYEWNEPLLLEKLGDFDPGEWVCIINGTDTIYAGMLSDAELSYRTSRRLGELTPETRKDLLKSRTGAYVLTSVGRELGYVASDSMQRAYRNFHDSEIINRIYRDRYYTSEEIPDAELRSYYDDHIKEFQTDKPLKIQQIVFVDSSQAASTLSELEQGADFGEMVKKYYPGEADFTETASDLGWISRDDLGGEFFDAIWSTETGKFAGPVRSQWGYHVVKMVDRRQILDFEQAKVQIRQNLRNIAAKKKNDDWVKWVTKGRDVVRYDDIIKQIDFSQAEHYFRLADTLRQAQIIPVDSGK